MKNSLLALALFILPFSPAFSQGSLGNMALQNKAAVQITGGTITGTTVSGLTLSPTTGTFTLTNAKTLTVTNTLTLSGTDGVTLTIPATGTAALLGANTFTRLQTITQGTANEGVLASTGFSLTGANAQSMLSHAGTLNTSGNPDLLKYSFTYTAAGASTNYLNLLAGAAGATPLFQIANNNAVVAGTAKFNFGLGAGNRMVSFKATATTNLTITTDDDVSPFFELVTNSGSGSSNPSVFISNGAFGLCTKAQSDTYLLRKSAAVVQLGLDAAGVTNQMLTASNRITSDGVGANLTVAAGNGRGGVAGNLILSSWTTAATGTAGTLTTIATVDITGFKMATAKVLSVASGPNQRAGNATLVGGTVTVSNTTVTANTVVLLTRKTSGGTIGTAITYTVSAGTSFTITSDLGTDTSTFSYLLIEVP